MGDTAPSHWSSMSDKFKLCGTGKNQSPIDISSHYDLDLPTIQFDYVGEARKVVNNGHTIQVNIKAGSQINIEGKTFDLKQFHFHTPSENTINGKSFPLEAHFVHRSHEDNSYAVVAVMFNVGAENPILKQVWHNMPHQASHKNAINKNLAYFSLMPEDKDYYRFNGSFTTPPCTEGVNWFVLKTPQTLSVEQVSQFFNVMKHANNRPVQLVGARVIVK